MKMNHIRLCGAAIYLYCQIYCNRNAGYTLRRYSAKMHDTDADNEASCAHHTCFSMTTMQYALPFVVCRISWSFVQIIWSVVIICTWHHVSGTCDASDDGSYDLHHSCETFAHICQIDCVVYLQTIQCPIRWNVSGVGLFAHSLKAKLKSCQELPGGSKGNRYPYQIWCWWSQCMASITHSNCTITLCYSFLFCSFPYYMFFSISVTEFV